MSSSDRLLRVAKGEDKTLSGRLAVPRVRRRGFAIALRLADLPAELD